MKESRFYGVSPYEIGDKINVYRDGVESMHEITDICAIHYVKDNRMEFRYELSNEKQYYKLHNPSNVSVERKETKDIIERTNVSEGQSGEKYVSKVIEFKRKDGKND